MARAPAKASTSPVRAWGPAPNPAASPAPMTTAPIVARTIPTQASRPGGSPRNTEPRPTNSGAELTRVVAAPTVVSAREAFQRAKWAARNPPEAASRRRSRRVSGPAVGVRGANGASTAAPARQRQKARARAGRAATRIRMGEVEMAVTPTAIHKVVLVRDWTFTPTPQRSGRGRWPPAGRPRPGRRPRRAWEPGRAGRPRPR